ncbi:MAG TPA: AAA family ATPase, partial [Polyangium sp.]|nr:AAA family ATPase [Polyangium sp.]
MRPLLVTFYSYKGGVGRTQGLANAAVALANRGRNVVVVDMDLESPGVHSFFSPPATPTRRLTDADL